MKIGFTFDTGDVAELEVTGHRATMVNHEPDGTVAEELEFGTAVVPLGGGGEQRSSFRKRPRQAFRLEYLFDVDSTERRRWSNFLFGAQDRLVALPLLHEGIETSADAAIGATLISVPSTASIDFRIGGHVVVFSDADTFDVAAVQSISPSQVTLATPTVNAYAAGATIAPVRFARIDGVVTSARPPMGVVRVSVRYEVLENDVGAPDGDLSGLPTLGTRVIFDRRNVMPRGDLNEAWAKNVTVIDNGSGIVRTLSDWDRNQHGFQLGFSSVSRAELWQTRELLYALRGRFSSFWVPTMQQEVVLVDGIAMNDDTLTVQGEGYLDFVRSRQSKATLRVTAVDGTVVVRTVISADVCDVDAGTEILTIDEPWPVTLELADVARVEWLELVRFASDLFQFDYSGRGRAKLQTSCVVVRDEPEDNIPEDWGSVAEAPSDYDEWGAVADIVTSSSDWGGVG